MEDETLQLSNYATLEEEEVAHLLDMHMHRDMLEGMTIDEKEDEAPLDRRTSSKVIAVKPLDVAPTVAPYLSNRHTHRYQPYETQKTAEELENVSFKKRINRLQEKNQELQKRVARLEASEADKEQQLQEVLQQLENTTMERNTALHDLNTSRAFVSVEEGNDGRYLIETIKQLNSDIDDFAYRIAEQIPEEIGTYKFCIFDADRLRPRLKECEEFDTFIEVACEGGITFTELLQILVQYKVCRQLRQHIFLPFIAGQNNPEDGLYHELYNKISQNESQERSGRWRSMTYSHLSNEINHTEIATSLATSATLEVFTIISHIMHCIGFKSIEFDQDAHSRYLQQVALKAISFKDKTQKDYLSYDYEAFLPGPRTYFCPEKMQAHEQNSTLGARRVLISIGFGLLAWKSAKKEGQKFIKESAYPVKALVVCDNWIPDS